MIRPSRGLMSMEDYSLKPFTLDDLPGCYSMLLSKDNILIMGNTSLSSENFFRFYEATKIDLWSLRMICICTDQPIGFVLNMNSDISSLHTRILGIFLDPQRCKLPLLLFIRHLFWSFPLQRIYVQVPCFSSDEYTKLYESVGFQQEGIYRQHQIIAGYAHDVRILGLLRHEFEIWCGTYDSRFVL